MLHSRIWISSQTVQQFSIEMPIILTYSVHFNLLTCSLADLSCDCKKNTSTTNAVPVSYRYFLPSLQRISLPQTRNAPLIHAHCPPTRRRPLSLGGHTQGQRRTANKAESSTLRPRAYSAPSGEALPLSNFPLAHGRPDSHTHRHLGREYQDVSTTFVAHTEQSPQQFFSIILICDFAAVAHPA